MNIDLKQLETFVHVADLGSFRKAAERLNTTQPNVSARIARLEEVLDTPLLERGAGSVRPTAAGRALLEHARDVLRAVDGFVAAAARPALFGGVLRLGVTELIVHTWLRDYLGALKARFPETLVELSVDLSAALDRQLAERSIDLALQSGPYAHVASGSLALGTHPLVWVAAPGNALRDVPDVPIARLAEHPILTHARDTGPFRDVRRHFAAHRGIAARVVPSSNLAACVQMTVDAMGVAVLLRPMVRAELADGRLVEIDYRWLPASLAFHARYDAGRASHVVATAASVAADVAAITDPDRPDRA